jgi:hypothetical protein
MTRSFIFLSCLALAACVVSDLPPEVRRDVPGFVFCTPEGESPLAQTLVGRPLDAAQPYLESAMWAGVVVDVAEISEDGSTLALAIETTDILTILHRDGITDSISCIPRDVCTGPRRAESGLCRGSLR